MGNQPSGADYSRPAAGFRYKSGGLKTNSPADALGDGRYTVFQNVRATDDTTLVTRPGLDQLFTTSAVGVTDIRAYSRLSTDNAPRFLTRDADDTIWLDDGTQVGTLTAGGPGATLIPFRPNESPNPYMYIANGSDYQKFSAPTAGDVVTQEKVGLIEPQEPANASISAQIASFQGQPFLPFSYVGSGSASGVAAGNRITDTVVDVFPDPNGTVLHTLQVVGGIGSGLDLTKLYLFGPVTAYLFSADHSWNGGFGFPYPLDTTTATATAQGNSVNFNPIDFNGTLDPNVQPMEWAVQDSSGAITGYQQVPTTGGVGSEQYDMVVLFHIFAPAAGNFTLKINHDDGMIFAVSGATAVSGPFSDAFNHTKTVVQGLQFAGGGVKGTNQSGFSQESFVLNFPAVGVYAVEIDYAQWINEQSLNIRNSDGSVLFQSGATQSYQREMAILIDGNYTIVQDVFPALPAALSIRGIYYYDQTLNTGRCVVVPNVLSPAAGTEGQSLYSTAILSGIRRGSLVQIGTEVCYVLSTTVGPDGTICFETTTTATHTNFENITGQPAISVLRPGVLAGAAITSPNVEFSCTTGIGTCTNPVTLPIFQPFQDEDYIHFSIKIDNLAGLNEAKLMFDVSDGSFTQDFYFYTIRPSDIAAGVQNTLTQLGVAQLVSQRAAIDEERAAQANNQGVTYSSRQTVPGSDQWSEILFPISALTRAGNAQEKSLQNCGKMQLLINASGTINVSWNSVWIGGGFGADVGDSGAPYQYLLRPRSSVTGVKGNPTPTMRYGINPRRLATQVFLPATYPDPQMNTWDIFRYGGSITSYRFIGSALLGTTVFNDIYGDDAAAEGEVIEYDNQEPWPSIDVPFVGTATTVVGTVATVTAGTPNNVTRFLPGNLVRIGGQNVYTLWTRPTQITPGTYLFQFTQNAAQVNAGQVNIYEPQIAKQRLPYMWGPDAEGTMFAVGDPLRPGTLSFAKNSNPDSAPDKYNIEITSPSEPLLGGEVLDGVSYVASTERWWRLYPQDNEAQRYSVLQQAISRGLAAPFGHCSDGATIYWWAKDGIWATSKGSLTDQDLYNLFPHEGVAGQDIDYNAFTIKAPDYARAGTFRIAWANGYLYCVYQDSDGDYHQLVHDLRRSGWSYDEHTTAVSAVYHVEQPEGTLLTNTTLYPQLVMGRTDGVVAKQLNAHNDVAEPIVCGVGTQEFDNGDVRANQWWGDVMLDVLPAAPAGVVATAVTHGAGVFAPTTVASSAVRNQSLVSLGGGQFVNFLGLLTTWTDDFTQQTVPTELFIWQPTLIPKPETTQDRTTDWDMAGTEGAKWFQGFVMRADTFGDVKVVAVQDSDSLTNHAYTPVVQHQGESVKAYSFNNPFIAHEVRMVPGDQVPWRFFEVVWVTEPTPEVARTWETQSTAHGLTGYMHVKQLSVAYAATAPVTLTITSYDGQSPVPVTLPATGGDFQKRTVILTANKGMLYHYRATSDIEFQMYLPDLEVMVGRWGREEAYLRYRNVGGDKGDQARV